MSIGESLALLSKRVVSQNDAVQVVGQAARGCYLVAAIQSLMSLFYDLWGLAPAILYVILGMWLQWRHSRIAAFILLMHGVAGVVGMVAGVLDLRLSFLLTGYTAFRLPIVCILIFLGYRAWQATYRLASAASNRWEWKRGDGAS